MAGKGRQIDELMNKASESLTRGHYFEAERMCLKALAMARQDNDFERMARVVLPLQEARRQRMQTAMDCGEVTVLDGPITEEMKITPGCYLVQPPQVGADARRFRLAAWHAEVAVLVLCREPMTQLRLWPIVAIGPGATVRLKIDPPDDRDHPDLPWMLAALEELGDYAMTMIDPKHVTPRQIDTVLEHLDAIPEHEKLHQQLEELCRTAHRESTAEPLKKPARGGSRAKSSA